MHNILKLLNREEKIFSEDIHENEKLLTEEITNSRILVIGGAGSIGQATTKELFKRNPSVLHVVDISENNMVELVRDIRSTIGYAETDFRTFALDSSSYQFEYLVTEEGPYDYILNLSALKHVRSEEDPFTLMRLIEVNIFNTLESIKMAKRMEAKKYFCVSTDKAANPVNMMGASKRIMEMFLMRESESQSISTARFANVAFSDGSLLHGFNQRFTKRQPIAAPKDVRRYFVTFQESGELCMMSAILGENRDIFFPKLSEKLHLVKFSEIAKEYLAQMGYEAIECETEQEARKSCKNLIKKKKWPCYFFDSDTTGEKDFEEFFTEREVLDFNRFREIGIIKNNLEFDEDGLSNFENLYHELRTNLNWDKKILVDSFLKLIPNFSHLETGKYLNQRM